MVHDSGEPAIEVVDSGFLTTDPEFTLAFFRDRLGEPNFDLAADRLAALMEERLTEESARGMLLDLLRIAGVGPLLRSALNFKNAPPWVQMTRDGKTVWLDMVDGKFDFGGVLARTWELARRSSSGSSEARCRRNREKGLASWNLGP